MQFATTNRPARSFNRGLAWQSLAALYCVLFGLAIILNVQMGGEAMWFWYATLFHRGVKLYSDLHLVLQPFYVLETNAWMRVAGSRCIPYETLGVLHLLGLCASIFLVLRESNWPDWQKAILLAGTFLIIIRFTAYRFDDFHVVADTFYLLGMVLLLWLARAKTQERIFYLSAALGLLSGLAITNRLTDGGVLMAAAGMALPFMAPKRKIMAVLLFAAALLFTWWFVVFLTGDSFHAYVTNSVIRASGAKGGTSNVLRGPFVALADSYQRIVIGSKRKIAVLSVLVLIGAMVHRYWRKDARLIILVEVVAAYLLALIQRLPGDLYKILTNTMIETLSTIVQPLAYLLCFAVAFRALRAAVRSSSDAKWDKREAVVLVPAATLLSAAVSQATGTSNSTITMALLFLLLPIFLLHDENGWPRASFLTLIVLSGIVGTKVKVVSPYDWGSIKTKPMFVGREWYQHPLYGPMYIDSSILHFNRNLCEHIGATDAQGRNNLQLLSIPFPYANYFCGVPPWKNYVQLWYDTVTPATVATVMQQLSTDPPDWVLYERYPAMIEAHEIEYNHRQPIPHRYLDLLMVKYVVEQRWTIDQQTRFIPGEAWYLLRTRP